MLLAGFFVAACAPAPATPDGGSGGGSAVGGGGGGGQLGGGGGDDAGLDDAGTDDAGVDDAGTDAGFDAGLDGGCAVTVLPATLTFGATVPGCVASASLTLQNGCGAAESVSIGTTGPFFTDAGTFTLDAGASVQVALTFSPFAVGPMTGVATVTSSTVAMVPLSGLGDSSAITTDTFRTPNRPRANVLFVVSDGPGMTDAQQAIAASFPSLLQYAQSSQFDFRVGILAGRADGGTLVGGVITQNRPNAAAQFSSSIALGSAGTPTQSCLERAVQELSTNAGWLIPRGSFALVCVQNTLEQAPTTATASLQTLGTLVGNPTHFTVDGVANFVPGCPAPDDVRLRALVDATQGEALSICPSDAGIAALPRGLLGQYENTFILSRPVDATAAIEVRVDGALVPAVDAVTGNSIWVFDVARNAVIFAPVMAPQPGASVAVRYSRACGP